MPGLFALQAGFKFGSTHVLGWTAKCNVSDPTVQRQARLLQAMPLSSFQQHRQGKLRALVEDPPILVLDEVTVRLDPQGESALFEGSRKALRGRTVLLITPRTASLAVADRILRMEGRRMLDETRRAPGDARRPR